MAGRALYDSGSRGPGDCLDTSAGRGPGWISHPAGGDFGDSPSRGTVLIFLGGTMSRDAIQNKLALDLKAAPSERRPRIHPAIAGVTVSIANPYWWLWWATIGLSYITLAMNSGSLGLASFFTGHISADLAWYSLVTIAVSGGRRFINARVYQVVLTGCGIFLVGMGIYFIYSGIMM